MKGWGFMCCGSSFVEADCGSLWVLSVGCMPGPMDCEGPSPRSKPAGHIGIKSAILAPRGVRCPILTICLVGS